MVALPVRRTVWSTTIDTGDERAECTVWSGAAADVARILMHLQVTGDPVGPVRVTLQALASHDGEAWAAAGWMGSAPSVVVAPKPRLLGPFTIDPSHGKRLLRVTLSTEAVTTGLVVGAVVGTLYLVGP